MANPDGKREGETGADVRVALAETSAEPILILGGHERTITYPLVKYFASKRPGTQTYVALASMIG